MSVSATSIVQTVSTTKQKVRGFYTLASPRVVDTICVSLECEILDGCCKGIGSQIKETFNMTDISGKSSMLFPCSRINDLQRMNNLLL